MESELEFDLTKGCKHKIRKNCDLKCSKCEKFYPCRYCHDEDENMRQRDPDLKHEMIMKDIKEIKCRRCNEV